MKKKIDKEEKIGNILTIIIVIAAIIIIPIHLKYEKEMLKNSATTKGVIEIFRNTPGDRVGQPEVVVRVTIAGVEKMIDYERMDLDAELGDCVEIIYSLEDPRVSKINYEKGKVSCD